MKNKLVQNPKVSILIPMYNAKNYISETIQFCLNQTYKNIEIIIVDDGSTDHSCQIVEKYVSEKVHLYQNPRKGACAARNYAFEKSSGEYIQFLDADDFCSPDKIEKQIEQLRDKNNKTLAFCKLHLLRNGEMKESSKRYIDKDYTKPVKMLVDMWANNEHNNPHCYLMHRDLFLSTSGWDESILQNQDGEFFSRIIEQADHVCFTKGVYAVWRLSNNGISSQHNLKVMTSKLETIKSISQIILNYEDIEKTREICAYHLGWFSYLGYPENKPLMPKVYALLKNWNTQLVIPAKGRLFVLLRKCIGWKLAATIVKNPTVIRFCNLIDTRK